MFTDNEPLAPGERLAAGTVMTIIGAVLLWLFFAGVFGQWASLLLGAVLLFFGGRLLLARPSYHRL